MRPTVNDKKPTNQQALVMHIMNIMTLTGLMCFASCSTAQKLTADGVAKELDRETFKLKEASLGLDAYTYTKEARSVGMELADQLRVASQPSDEYLKILHSYASVIKDVNQGKVDVDRGEFAKLLAEDLEIKVKVNELDMENLSVAKVVPAVFRVVQGGEELNGVRVTCQPDLFEKANSDVNLTSVFPGSSGTAARINPGKYTYKVYKADELIFRSSSNLVFIGMEQPIVIQF